MEVIHRVCCGMDISKRDAKVCVRVQHGSKISTDVTTWSAVSSKILELGEFLKSQKVTCVVMEATSDYWKAFYFLLSESN